MMRILGIHIGHDSSAALVVDGKVIADVSEERFTRIKHYNGLPTRSIAYCLEAGGISAKDVDIVAVPNSGGIPELNHLLQLRGAHQEKRSPQGRILDYARRVAGRSTAHPPLYMKTFSVRESAQVVHVEHHLAHAASAYYTCGSTEKFLIVTCDGIGDGVSLAVWRGENGKITPLEKWGPEASIGWFYSNVTEALGWWHGDGEGKTMGLAPYGDYNKALHCLDGLYPEYEGGRLVKPHDFGTPNYWNEGGALQYHMTDANLIHELVQRHGKEHVAAEAQRVLEEQLARFVFPWMEREKIPNLCAAGGVFLNVKLNQKLWYSDKIAKHHIFPNAGDSGLAVGAALYAWHEANPSAPIGRVDHLYWGPSYTNEEIEQVLQLDQLKARYVEDIAGAAAQSLADGKILGWLQGRMESGPRALGGRSILMSPCKSEHKDIINARVKFREAFRPFCPSLTIESRDAYLRKPRDERYMITAFEVTPEKADRVPAVVHVDGTLRPQLVAKDTHPLYWDTIRRFGEITGEPMLLNTSFNVMGEPIVCTPQEAIRCFYSSGIDMLFMGNWVLSKS